ncbi:hypothetical protein D9756_011528 [Leucocoprinus leucothites]|uniref:Nephrocystin 3-like N-terminal domain-containing protein n=1 Tax=Leucocoprinus leucothites TaxID=201217 RepID=A0A8H5CMJ5_9AGAR|nr:hypothetical protein D9756_011528 [Leucoagaricus leucothites]
MGVYNSSLGTLCSFSSENRTNNVSSSLPLNAGASVVDWSAGGMAATPTMAGPEQGELTLLKRETRSGSVLDWQQLANVDMRHVRGGSDDNANKQERDQEDCNRKQEKWTVQYPNQLSLLLRAPTLVTHMLAQTPAYPNMPVAAQARSAMMQQMRAVQRACVLGRMCWWLLVKFDGLVNGCQRARWRGKIVSFFSHPHKMAQYGSGIVVRGVWSLILQGSYRALECLRPQARPKFWDLRLGYSESILDYFQKWATHESCNERPSHDADAQPVLNIFPHHALLWNLSINEAQTTPSKRPKLIEPGNSGASPSTKLPQHGQDPSHSTVLNSAITPGSQLQDPRDQHQDAPSFFSNASGFQIHNSTIIGSVVQCADAAKLPFPDSYVPDGQKLRKALVGGLEFIPLAKECMKDTRVAILSDVDDRVRDHEGSNIIWIKGFPGVGKSALASTIVSRLRGRGELLSYFVFDRAKPTITTTRAFWRRVAWDLARLYPAVRPSLLKQIDDETLDVNTPNIGSLFTSLIIKPLSGLSGGDLSSVRLHHPVVVVIDATDECGGLEGPRSDDRKTLLKTLQQWHSELPKNFKVVVTSREEDDIKRHISPISTHIHISIDTNEASSDIRKYLEGHLGDIASAYSELPVDWVCQTANHLAKRAAGVFIWATTIANFIEAGEPQSQLEDIDAGLGLGGEEGSLYALYANILKISFKNLHGKQMEAFKCVVGAVIFAQRPFHNSEFAAINPVVTGSMLEYIRNGMRSVIDQGPTLHFVHQSFVDFLLSPGCPGEFAIREPEQQHQLSTLCLTTMSKQLRFNICGLETSSLENMDVPDIETKVEVGIPSLLSYSCCFVADHLCHTAFDECLMDGVRVVFKEKLLYWLEAMSLLEEVHRVVPILRMVVDWITARDGVLTEFVCDALRFVMAFTIPMMESAPHIYLSALPFAPKESLVAKYFLPGFPQLLALDTGKPSHWSPCVFVSEYHKGPIYAIAFSPDETIFASGDWDGTICIWDSATGILISGPFFRSGRNSFPIESLDFSPDGKYLVSTRGNQGIVIWDVERDKEHLCFGDFSERPGSALLHGDTEEEIRSAVYTKDGNMIVSRSSYGDLPDDRWDCCCRVRLWDASTGTLAHILLDLPRSTNDYLLSPNAHFLASLSNDPAVLRVWELTERPPRRVIEQDDIGERSFGSSLVFSPDGKFLLVVTRTPEEVYMAHLWRMDTHTLVGPTISLGPGSGTYVLYSCGADNLAIGVHGKVLAKILDAITGDMVYCSEEPNRVWCCSPSRNGRRILLGYVDGTIRMWDYHRYTQVSHVINSATDDDSKDLAGWVKPVFSPCGKTLAVSYEDKIRLLDVTTGEPINLSHRIQTKSDMLAFSRDGRYIASLTTRRNRDELPVANIWDTNTGMNHHCLVITDAAKEGHFDLFFAPSNNQLVLCGSVEGGEEERYVIHIWEDDVLDEPFTKVTLPRPKSCNTNLAAPELVLSPDTLTALVLEHTTSGAIVHCHRRSSIEEQFTSHALFDRTAIGQRFPGGQTKQHSRPVDNFLHQLYQWATTQGYRVNYESGRRKHGQRFLGDKSRYGTQLHSDIQLDEPQTFSIQPSDPPSLSPPLRKNSTSPGFHAPVEVGTPSLTITCGVLTHPPSPQRNEPAEVRNGRLYTAGDGVSVHCWRGLWVGRGVSRSLGCDDSWEGNRVASMEPLSSFVFELETDGDSHAFRSTQDNAQEHNITHFNSSPLLTSLLHCSRCNHSQLDPLINAITGSANEGISGVIASPLRALHSFLPQNPLIARLPVGVIVLVVDGIASGNCNTHNGKTWAWRACAVGARNG